MDTITALWSFALVVGLLTLTPGLDTALILRTAALRSRREAWGVVLGIQAGTLAWGTLSSLGVSALLTASHTAYEVLRRQLDSFTKRVAAIPSDRPALEAALTILRDITTSSTNAVLYELMIAARTDEKLNATLQHVLEQYSTKICDAARALPGAESFPQETFPVLVALLTNTFDGAALVGAVLPQPELDQRRIQLLLSLLSGVGLPA